MMSELSAEAASHELTEPASDTESEDDQFDFESVLCGSSNSGPARCYSCRRCILNIHALYLLGKEERLLTAAREGELSVLRRLLLDMRLDLNAKGMLT